MRKYHDPMDDILDRPIAYNPALKRITGSTNAAILLSQAWYWTKRTKNKDGWFYKTRDEWCEETALTVSELDGARRVCRDLGVIEEKLKGVPATLHYRVNKEKIYSLLGVQIQEVPDSSFPENCQIPEKLESEKPKDFNKESENTTENTTENEKIEFQKRQLSSAFWSASHIPEPNPGAKGWQDWLDGLDQLMKIEAMPEEVRAAVVKLDELGYSYNNPGSTVKTIINMRKPDKPSADARGLPKGL